METDWVNLKKDFVLDNLLSTLMHKRGLFNLFS